MVIAEDRRAHCHNSVPQGVVVAVNAATLILNLDGVPSQRLPDVRSNAALLSNTCMLVKQFHCNIVVSSESSKRSADRLASTLGMSNVREALGYPADVSSIMWANDTWKLCEDTYVVSNVGKYISVRLEHQVQGFKLGIIAVHLKRGADIRKKLELVLTQFMCLKKTCHGVLIMGDFNAHVKDGHVPHDLRALFNAPTSVKTGKCIDNAITNLPDAKVSARIESSVKMFSHYPLRVQYTY